MRHTRQIISPHSSPKGAVSFPRFSHARPHVMTAFQNYRNKPGMLLKTKDKVTMGRTGVGATLVVALGRPQGPPYVAWQCGTELF
jgi:hypothetical protein